MKSPYVRFDHLPRSASDLKTVHVDGVASLNANEPQALSPAYYAERLAAVHRTLSGAGVTTAAAIAIAPKLLTSIDETILQFQRHSAESSTFRYDHDALRDLFMGASKNPLSFRLRI